MVSNAPGPLDVLDFKFKLHSKFKISGINNKNETIANYIATASHFGLIFIGTNEPQFLILRHKNIVENESKKEITSYPRRKIPLPSIPYHLAVNADHSLLSVIVAKNSCTVALIYDIQSFLSQSPVLVTEIRLSATANVLVTDLVWNPTAPKVFTVCMTDESVGMYEIKPNGIEINSLPPASHSRCICWSPKGKQIVIGASNGSISQYKPDLKLVKTYGAPPLNNSSNITITNIVWISNYQFVGVFQDLQNPSNGLALIVITTSKNGPVTYVNYEDICYSMGTKYKNKYYLIYQATWNILLAASANSIEVGVLGGNNENGTWNQWIQTDESRAELPLSASKDETYAIGLALDTSSTHHLLWGENQTLTPMPLLYIISDEGVLNIYNIINLRPNAPEVCSPPQIPSDLSGESQFITSCDSKTTNELSSMNLPLASIAPSLSVAENKNNHTFILPPANTKNELSFNIAVASTPVPSHFPKSTFNTSNQIAPILKTTVETNKIQLHETPPSQIKLEETLDSKRSKCNENETLTDNNLTVNNSLVIKLISDEQASFQLELNNLKLRLNNLNIYVGSDEQKEDIIKRTLVLEEFFKALKETTESQEVEIHQLKQMLLEGFALREEANSRYQNKSIPKHAPLYNVDDIDPVTNKLVSDIKRMLYYVESQLQQVDQYLDNEWSEFQNSCKRYVQDTNYTPSLAAVYQTLIRQKKIIEHQSFLLKDIKMRLKNRKQGTALLNKVSVKEAPNVDSILVGMNKLEVTNDNILSSKYNKIEEIEKKFSSSKEGKLRTFLLTNQVNRVIPAKPNTTKIFNSSLLLPISKDENLSFSKVDGNTSGVSYFENKTSEIAVKNDDKVDELTGNTGVSKKLSDYYENITPTVSPLKPIPSKTETNILSHLQFTNVDSSTEKTEKQDLKNKENQPILNIPTGFIKKDSSHITSNLFQGKNNDNSFSFTNLSQTSIENFKIQTSNTQSPFSNFTYGGNETTSIAPGKKPEGSSFTSPSLIGKTTEPSFPSPATSINFSAPTTASTETNLFTKTSSESIFSTSSTSFPSPNISISKPLTFTTKTTTVKEQTAAPATIFTIPSTSIQPSIANTSITATTAITTSASTSTSLEKSTFKIFEYQPKETFSITSSNVASSGTSTNVVTTMPSFNFTTKTDQKSIFASFEPTSSASVTVTTSTFTPTSFSFLTPQTSTNIFSTPTSNTSSGAEQKLNKEPPNVEQDNKEPTKQEVISNNQSPSSTATTTPPVSSIFGNFTVTSPVAQTTTTTQATTTFSFTNFNITTTTSSTPITTTTASIFSPSNVTATTTASVPSFGSLSLTSPIATQPSKELSAAQTFTSPTTTTKSSPFVGFGNLTVTALSPQTVASPVSSFGNLTVSALSPTATSTTSSSFGNFTQSTSVNTFGFNSAPTNVTTTSTNSASGFSFRQNIFSQPTSTSTTESNTFMGKQICSPFSPSSTTPTSSIFGGASATPNVFEQSNQMSIFGNSPNTATSQSSSAASIFAKPAFGQQQAGSIFGAKPSFGQSAFGQPSTFGTQSNVFGGAASFGSNTPSQSVFSPTSTANTFGSSGSFNTGGQTSTFGSPLGFQKTAPAFGSPPSFGSPGGFGAPPTFGGSPTFGSPEKVFGQSSPVQSNTFGSVPQNSTFANLATQNTVGFGNLVQNQNTQANTIPAFSQSSSFTSWR